MTSTSKTLPVRLRAFAQGGIAALFALAIASGCGSSSDKNGAPNGSGGNTGSAGSAGAGAAANDNGGMNNGAGTSNAGNAGTANGGSSVAGSSMTGEAGSAEAGAPSAVCGNGKLEPGEECDDGNTKDGDGCSSICTNKCELCETAANCSTKYDLSQPCKTQAECRNRANEAASFDLCYGTGQDVASAGPGAGQLKSTLCQAVIACFRKSNCAADFNPFPLACYCGDVSDTTLCETAPAGPCVEELAAAAEARSLDAVQQAWAAQDPTTTAGAAANIIVNCDQSACADQCFEDKTPTACQQCAVGSNAHDYNLECPDYTTCYFYGDTEVNDGVTILPMAKLCAPAVDCAIRTGCGANGAESCYGNGTGPCAAEFAAAADSTDPATVLSRMQPVNGSFPAAFAESLLDCEAAHCASDCFPNGAGGGAGTGGASAGTGGASAGTGGASAGTGGASAGTGGASAGTGGASAGTGGASAGTGGASAGTGGASAGTGGA